MPKTTKKQVKKRVTKKPVVTKTTQKKQPADVQAVKKTLSFTKNQLVGVVVGIVILLILYLVLFGKPDMLGEGILAKVNGEVITQEEVDKVFEQLSKTNPQLTKEIIINQTIMRYLILDEAKNAKVKVSDKEIDDYFANVEKTLNQDIEAAMKEIGVTKKEFREQIREQLMITNFMLGKIESHEFEVTDKELNKLYKEAEDSLQVKERVHASHILLETENEAIRVAEQLRRGADFDTLALEKSIDPSAQQNKGDLGFFERGKMVKPFEDAAFALDEGMISTPVKSSFGYHVIKLHKKDKARSLNFEEVRQDLLALLTEQKQQEFLTGFVNGLWAKADIQVFA